MTTKSLAKELGLIRKRGQSSSDARRSQSVCGQRFSYLIVIDFESTCWREKNSFGQEIIEFPAVLLNLSNGKVESEFHSFVQPQEHPILSEFCVELTGITQEQVESGPPLHICLSRFMRWLHTLQQDKGVVFETDSKVPAPSGHLCAFVTWSDWDLGVCLLYECKRKQIRFPEALKAWTDLRATYRLFYNRKPKGLRGALQDLGIQFSGREHSGLADARNTALLAWRMVSDGCVLTLTKSLRRVAVKTRPLRGNTSAGRWTRPSAVCERKKQQSEDSETTVCQSLISPRTVLSSTTTPLSINTSKPLRTLCSSSNILLKTTISSLTHSTLSDMTYDPETPDTCWQNRDLLTEEEEPGSYDDVPLEEERSSYDDVPLEEEPKPEPSVSALIRVGSCSERSDLVLRTKHKLSEHGNSEPPLIQSCCSTEPSKTRSNRKKQDPPRPVSCISVTTDRFKTPKPLSHKVPYEPLSHLLGHSTAPFTIYRDPTTDSPISTSKPCLSRPPFSSAVNHSSVASKTSSLQTKITSPLCSCGRRARRLTVGNGGPNHGRVFYCCPVKRQRSDGRQKGCEFFQWESGLIKSSIQTLIRTWTSRTLR